MAAKEEYKQTANKSGNENCVFRFIPVRIKHACKKKAVENRYLALFKHMEPVIAGQKSQDDDGGGK